MWEALIFVCSMSSEVCNVSTAIWAYHSPLIWDSFSTCMVGAFDQMFLLFPHSSAYQENVQFAFDIACTELSKDAGGL